MDRATAVLAYHAGLVLKYGATLSNDPHLELCTFPILFVSNHLGHLALANVFLPLLSFVLLRHLVLAERIQPVRLVPHR